jgi:hypothetical protein
MPKLPAPSSTFAPPPAGTFPAICYRILDLGTQQSSYMGKPRTAHKILISWEIKDDEAVMEDGRPMSIHQNYTWSMNEKANLRKDLESWRGKRFTDADFGEDGFELADLLGVPCFMGVVHKDVDGTTYANISAISKLPKGMTVPPLVNKPLILWLDHTFDKAAFAELSEGMQNKIKGSPEYQSVVEGKKLPGGDGREPLDDEIPF